MDIYKVIDLINKNYSQQQIADTFSVSRKTVRYFLIKNNLKTNFIKQNDVNTNKIINSKTVSKSTKLRDIALPNNYKFTKNTKYVLTSAINNTAINEDFLGCIKTFCSYNKADLLVCPIRYKNPTIILDSGQYEVFWPSELTDFYVSENIELNGNLNFNAKVHIQATTTLPLSGLSIVNNNKHAIYGHPVQWMETYANKVHKHSLTAWTTGTLSQIDYSNTKQGHKASALHKNSALLVEIDNEGVFYVRYLQYSQDHNNIIDLDKIYTSDKVHDSVSAEALVMGDLHVGDHCDSVISSTKKLINQLKVKNVILHDAFNGHSISRYNENDLILKHFLNFDKKTNLSQEIDDFGKFLSTFCNKDINYYFIQSNHNDWLDRWIRDKESNKDYNNLKLYHKLSYEVLARSGYDFNGNLKIENAFKIVLDWISAKYLTNPKFDNFNVITEDDELIFKEIDCSNHGHRGVNGTRGSVGQFQNLQNKNYVGHFHHPFIRGNCHGVGTSTKLKLGYNGGLSTWLNCHGLIYSNGERTPIIIINGKYTIGLD